MKVREWLRQMSGGRYVNIQTVIRFLGTTPDSSSIIPLLTNLCHQISFVHRHQVMSASNDSTETQPGDTAW